MLLDLFKNKKIFKLVCGAGNEDAIEIEKLVTLYSKAGCNFFDLCAKPEIVDAAKSGLKQAGIIEDRYLCVSVGINGDPHVSKANILESKCLNCGACYHVCPQNAILDSDNKYVVNTTRCIGCGKCFNTCPNNCIERVNCAKDLNLVLPELIEKGIDCIEFHVLGTDEKEIDKKWQVINSLYNGPLCISIERSKIGTDDILARIKRMIDKRVPYSTIIQADGIAMSGGDDTYRATLQAVAIAEMFQCAHFPVYLMVSGGTNSKTTELARICDVDIQGVAIGSFARKIVREYIDREDFLENEEVFNKALKIAKQLVNISLENLS